jgi:hypothetical protein
MTKSKVTSRAFRNGQNLPIMKRVHYSLEPSLLSMVACIINTKQLTCTCIAPSKQETGRTKDEENDTLKSKGERGLITPFSIRSKVVECVALVKQIL